MSTPETTPTLPQRSLLERIFLSESERRLRAGWRLLIHTCLLLVVLGLTFFVLLFAFGMLSTGLNMSGDGLFFLNELGLFIAVTIATFAARRLIDRRSITSLGLKMDSRAVQDLAAGLVISAVMMGSIYSAEVALGWTTFHSFAWQSESAVAVAGAMALWLGTFILGGWAEELLSRGYHLQNLADGLNLFWGVLISSSIFGALHLGNPDASWISTLGILLAGLFLALPYLLTRQLWLSIGLHIGWNFFEGVVFGFPVSGIDTYTLLRHTVSGPELWTGGGFGPEAGLLLIPALLLGALLVYVYTRPANRSAS